MTEPRFIFRNGQWEPCERKRAPRPVWYLVWVVTLLYTTLLLPGFLGVWLWSGYTAADAWISDMIEPFVLWLVSNEPVRK